VLKDGYINIDEVANTERSLRGNGSIIIWTSSIRDNLVCSNSGYSVSINWFSARSQFYVHLL